MSKISTMLRSLTLLGLAGVLACSKAPDTESPPPGFPLEDFSRQWVHSVEEQESFDSPEHLYRPEGSKEFPPSMYRKRYVFHANGSVEYLWPSPADAHEMRTGTWERDAQQSDVIHIQEGDQLVSYQVLEVTPDLLRMRLLTQ
jgi:hypothetical protein